MKWIEKWNKKTISLRTNHLWLHITRALIDFAAFSLFYSSLKYIKLSTGNVLLLINQLFIPILTFLFLFLLSLILLFFHHRLDNLYTFFY